MTDRQAADLAALADLCTPWCVHVVATLRIADLIAAGATDLTDLAARAGCDAGSLDRVLRHLVSGGVFEQAAPGRFGLNEAAEAGRTPRPAAPDRRMPQPGRRRAGAQPPAAGTIRQ